jgi:hypothetical protein
MNIPSDKEFARLQAEMKQRQLLRGCQGFLRFFRACLFVVLFIGVIALLLLFFFHRHLDLVAFIVFGDLVVLAMILLVSTQLAGIKRDQEAEQRLRGSRNPCEKK